MLSRPENPGTGDRLQTFQEILRNFEESLHRLTAVYAAEPADREDLFQEVLLAIWTALPRFRGDCSARTWIYRIAHNVAITASVNRNRRRRAELPIPPDVPARKALEPESQSLARERWELLTEAVRSLRGLNKQVTVLHLEGLSNREIAEVVGLTEGAIATRLSRVRVALSRLVGTNTGEI
jgi:RNA polymerase sigma factor (sigma-70 family)